MKQKQKSELNKDDRVGDSVRGGVNENQHKFMRIWRCSRYKRSIKIVPKNGTSFLEYVKYYQKYLSFSVKHSLFGIPLVFFLEWICCATYAFGVCLLLLLLLLLHSFRLHLFICEPRRKMHRKTRKLVYIVL